LIINQLLVFDIRRYIFPVEGYFLFLSLLLSIIRSFFCRGRSNKKIS
jgi:hypothetical protein